MIYDALAPLAGSFANTTVAKPVTEHFLGLLSAALDDAATADEHFATAVTIEEKVGAPLLVAETRLEWARLLAATGANPGRQAELLAAVADAGRTYMSEFLRHGAELPE